MAAYRFADTVEKRPRHRFTLDFQLTPNFQPGLEYNAEVGEVGIRATWLLQRESETRPQIHANTSSDRIGTPEGYQQYSVTFAKSLHGSPLAGYVSLTYSEFDRGLVVPFGVSWQLSPEWSALALNDGRRSHLLVTRSSESWYVQAAWIWFERFGFTVGWGF